MKLKSPKDACDEMQLIQFTKHTAFTKFTNKKKQTIDTQDVFNYE